MYGSKKPAGRQKTYGKSVRTHISGIFGRSLWADVEPTPDSKLPTKSEATGAKKSKRRNKNRKNRTEDDSDSSSDSDLETKPIAKSSKTPEPVAPVKPDETLEDVANNLATLSLSKDKQVVIEKVDTEIIIVEEVIPESSASSLKESSDKENERSSPMKPKIKVSGTKEVNHVVSIEDFHATVAPRSILGERKTPESHKESPPRKRGLKKRPSAISCGEIATPGSSPLKNETRTEAPESFEDSIQVWEDHAQEIVIEREVLHLEVKSEEQPNIENENEEIAKLSSEKLFRKEDEAKNQKTLKTRTLQVPMGQESQGEQGEPTITSKEAIDEPEHPKVENVTSDASETSETSDLSAVPDLTPTEVLLDLCSSSDILDFSTHIDSLLGDSTIRKLGEASYSEVFLQSPVDCSEDTVVLKVIPFGKEEQCEIESITQEVRITKVMAEIEGFIGFRGAYVVKGAYPETLMHEWDTFDEERGSENERPDFYEDDQLFAVIMLENGGSDLEHTELCSWEEACDVFWQVALALARGEKQREFEHRDLHWGNIVIKRKHGQKADEEANPEEILRKLTLEDDKSTEKQSNLKVALIDYTLSRAWCGTHDEDPTYELMPLDDAALFTGKGDYQFDIYRFMRNHALSISCSENDPENELIDWNVYMPKTNLYWLHYLAYMLINKCDLARPAARGRNAASENEKNCYKQLEAVQNKINPRKKTFGKQAICESAEDLVEWGVNEEFLENSI